ncbi:LysE family translocator [Paracoccus pantotrophus]|uniref:LysE family translocator n=1 Tax=Paracoccus pantotrophus TaxID=82367 RepID=A0AAE6NSP4_PARPN|nr:LysE family translocator [Paracoccus pantotrophus]QFG35614.1 LysE family translocator [Paracoccus pantotrophus]
MLTEQISNLLPVFAVYLIAIASPGPSTMSIMGVAMQQGRLRAVALALGVVTGSIFWAILAASGISTALTAYAGAMFTIKVAGGLYLLYLAWKSARSALASHASQVASVPCAGNWALYRKGVLLHLSNPKAVLGWIAIMSLGVRPDAPSHTILIMMGGCAIMAIAVNVGYAIAFSTRIMGCAYQHSRRWIEGVLAAIFGVAGIRMLLSRP